MHKCMRIYTSHTEKHTQPHTPCHRCLDACSDAPTCACIRSGAEKDEERRGFLRSPRLVPRARGPQPSSKYDHLLLSDARAGIIGCWVKVNIVTQEDLSSIFYRPLSLCLHLCCLQPECSCVRMLSLNFGDPHSISEHGGRNAARTTRRERLACFIREGRCQRKEQGRRSACSNGWTARWKGGGGSTNSRLRPREGGIS